MEQPYQMDRGTKLTLVACFIVFSVVLYLSPHVYERPGGLAARAGEDEIRFAIIGDYGVGNADQVRVAKRLGSEAAALRTQFIVSAGDSFYAGGVASEYDPQLLSKFEHIYDAASLQVPWYITLGG